MYLDMEKQSTGSADVTLTTTILIDTNDFQTANHIVNIVVNKNSRHHVWGDTETDTFQFSALPFRFLTLFYLTFK